ncbi:MAG: hypothetical protein Alpg2KO_01300 [Alphaproteobacteria bacterium]
MKTTSDLLDLWGNHSQLARQLGVKPMLVPAWKRRNSIPGRYWRPLVEQAVKDGIEGVTLEELALLHDHRRTLSDTVSAGPTHPVERPATGAGA